MQQMTKNKKCCLNCSHFEERSSFCRLNPPVPVVVYEEDENNETVSKIKSMFSSIHLPNVDFCSQFDNKYLM
jgi:hypothetical protein